MCLPILYLVLCRFLVASLHGSMKYVWIASEQIPFGMNCSCPISKVKWHRSLEIWGLSCSLWLTTPLVECLPRGPACSATVHDFTRRTHHSQSCTPLDSSLNSLKHRVRIFWDLKRPLKGPLPLASHIWIRVLRDELPHRIGHFDSSAQIECDHLEDECWATGIARPGNQTVQMPLVEICHQKNGECCNFIVIWHSQIKSQSWRSRWLNHAYSMLNLKM